MKKVGTIIFTNLCLLTFVGGALAGPCNELYERNGNLNGKIFYESNGKIVELKRRQKLQAIDNNYFYYIRENVGKNGGVLGCGLN